MPAPLSIIIPTYNAQADLALCLQSLLPGLETGLIREVIVSDGGSTDQTDSIANNSGATLIKSETGRSAQLRTGAANARGEWMLFLHADTALSREWPERVSEHILDHAAMAAVFELKYRSDARAARWLERRAMRRARWFGLPYGDQGLLISKKLYDEIGGYALIPLMEDVKIVQTLGKSRLRILNAEARTSAAKYERDGFRRRAWHNASLLGRYLLGASPEALAKRYR